MSFGVDGIATASMSLSQTKIQNQVGVSLLKKTMDSQEQQATQLVDQMMEAVPVSAHKLDVLA